MELNSGDLAKLMHIVVRKDRLAEVADMYENDPVLRAAIQPLLDMVGDCNIAAGVDGEEDEDGVAAGLKISEERQRYFEEHYRRLLPDALLSILLYGFVAIHVVKTGRGSSRMRVPQVLPLALYSPAVRVERSRLVSMVAVDRSNNSMEKEVLMFTERAPPLDGTISSAVSGLTRDYLAGRELKAVAVRIDQRNAQNIIMCERALNAAKEDTDLSMFVDADRMTAQRDRDYYTNEANVERFWDHVQHASAIMSTQGIMPATLYPIADGYKPSNVSQPSLRTDIVGMELQRRDTVFANVGVPSSLVFSGSAHAASVVGAFHLLHLTVTRLCRVLGDLLSEVHAPGMVSVDNLREAYAQGMLTPEVFGKYFLSSAHIPLRDLNPEVRSPDFLQKRAMAEAGIVTKKAKGNKGSIASSGNDAAAIDSIVPRKGNGEGKAGTKRARESMGNGDV